MCPSRHCTTASGAHVASFKGILFGRVLLVIKPHVLSLVSRSTVSRRWRRLFLSFK